jgi:hypothetical protein
MPRYYHAGLEGFDIEAISKAQAVDEEDRIKIKTALAKHHPLTSPNREQLVAQDGKVFLKKPGMYCQFDMYGRPIPELVPWEAGSIAIGILGHGFHVVPLGGYVDFDVTLPEKVVKDAAPHLLSEAEYLLRNASKTKNEPGQKAKA